MRSAEAFYLSEVLGLGSWPGSSVGFPEVSEPVPQVSVLVFEELNPEKHELIKKMFLAIECDAYEIIEGNIDKARGSQFFYFGALPENLKTDTRLNCGAPTLNELMDEKDPEVLKTKKRVAWANLQLLKKRL
jgi:hypothetical protein